MATNVHMKHQNKGKRDFNHRMAALARFGQISEAADLLRFSHTVYTEQCEERKTQSVTVHFPQMP